MVSLLFLTCAACVCPQVVCQTCNKVNVSVFAERLASGSNSAAEAGEDVSPCLGRPRSVSKRASCHPNTTTSAAKRSQRHSNDRGHTSSHGCGHGCGHTSCHTREARGHPRAARHSQAAAIARCLGGSAVNVHCCTHNSGACGQCRRL
jgi:hypothetical protein